MRKTIILLLFLISVFVVMTEPLPESSIDFSESELCRLFTENRAVFDSILITQTEEEQNSLIFTLSNYCEANNRPKEALELLRNYVPRSSFTDSLKDEAERLRAYYHNDSLVNAKKLRNATAKIKEESEEQNFKLIIGGVVAFLLTALLSFAIRSLYRYNTKSNEDIESKNKNITDSIKYASKIQTAILPAEEIMSKVFEEHFVIYRPKDIVSGDFYWLNKLEDEIFAAVIDCTGHGVPGAFMSMIGNTLLNHVITVRREKSPAKILEFMHQNIVDTLKKEQDEDFSRDGMDVCLCKINLSKRQVTFAGAKRPLYYCTDGEFHEIRGDLRSIGSRIRSSGRTFTNHEINYNSSITLYLGTDGYADQNGADGKKFGSKRFRRMLSENFAMPLSVQKEIYQKELEKHMADNPQRDDIALAAYRITNNDKRR